LREIREVGALALRQNTATNVIAVQRQQLPWPQVWLQKAKNFLTAGIDRACSDKRSRENKYSHYRVCAKA